MSAFGCCIWWLLLGALLGWLLNYLLCKSCKSKNNATNNQLTPPPSPPASKEVLAPVATAAVIKAASPLPAAAKPKPAPAKKKPAVAKPKPATAPAPAKNIAIDVAAAKTAGFKIKNADDLTVIEGIGPKINDLFKQNGLNTFTDVASSNATKMRAILDKGGARFRIANPSTWAKQAKLASTNKWKELKKLQDDLSGGIEK